MTSLRIKQSPLLWEGEVSHFCANLQKSDDYLMNLTNPNSIYVYAFLNFIGYKKFRVQCFVDTGASLCLASKFVIPDELWENAPKEISATIANGDTIKINKVYRNINLELSGEHFNVPTIYQQDSGIDIIIGNNF